MAENQAVTARNGVATEAEEYVTFQVGEEYYAIAAPYVQEIIELTAITKVPHLPEHFKGVINLRGSIIPVIDLKMKFRMTREGYQKHTCIIVTEFSGGVMGVIVDSVSDVVNIKSGVITEAPSFGTKVRTDFLHGMARVGENLILLLNVDRVLSDEELPLLGQSVEYAAAAGGLA